MHLLTVVEVGRRQRVEVVIQSVRGGRQVIDSTVVVGLLVGPIHTSLIASFKTPSVIKRTQIVELEVQRLMVVLGDASAKIIVGEIGGRVGINLFLVALTLHLADAEGSVECQLFVLAVKLARIQQVERMVYVVVVAGGNLFVPQRVVV